ncbi:thioredoxin family protein [Lacinutrix neustonica]|uniref:thioredoxin family protein n=1 Tax=Lacinutrix neustonica TaxID=2980107 RepID=UPI0036F24059
METINNTDLKTIITDSLQNAISYQEYRQLVAKLVEEGGTTGNEKTEALSNYTMLNDRRMKRWDKTVKVSEAIQKQVTNLNINQTWLVLTESWCGDAAHVLPVMHKMAALNDGIDFKLVMRDENPELMQQFLTNGGQAIPKLILIDNETGTVKSTFGPRPSEATELVSLYKAKHGSLTPNLKKLYSIGITKTKDKPLLMICLE